MLPPVDSETTTANPKFEALYRDLCTNKLNADGTTQIDAKPQRDREAFAEELRKARVAGAKKDLIRTYLQSLAYRGDELPGELQELVAIVAATLSAQISREDAGLLKDDVEKFKENIMLISLVVSKAAAEDITSLARIFSTGDTGDWRDLPTRISKAKTAISNAETNIADLRLQIVQEATATHALYRQAMEASIRILEQTIHGSVSRSTKAKAEYLAVVAEGMARKLQVQHVSLLAQTRSPEMQDALLAKAEALDREGMALKRKVREVEERLAEYREARAVEGLAKEYAEILRETEKVQADVKRLEQQKA